MQALRMIKSMNMNSLDEPNLTYIYNFGAKEEDFLFRKIFLISFSKQYNVIS